MQNKFNICNKVSHFRGENTNLDIKQFNIPAPVYKIVLKFCSRHGIDTVCMFRSQYIDF